MNDNFKVFLMRSRGPTHPPLRDGDASGLGQEPKLFVASEDEGMAGEVRRMAEEAPGERNEALVLRATLTRSRSTRHSRERDLCRAYWQGSRNVGRVAQSSR